MYMEEGNSVQLSVTLHELQAQMHIVNTNSVGGGGGSYIHAAYVCITPLRLGVSISKLSGVSGIGWAHYPVFLPPFFFP